MIHPRDLEPERLLTSTLDLLARASNVRPVLTLDGLPNVVTELDSLMSEAATAMRSA
jgi:predicted glycosyltransferase